MRFREVDKESSKRKENIYLYILEEKLAVTRSASQLPTDHRKINDADELSADEHAHEGYSVSGQIRRQGHRLTPRHVTVACSLAGVNRTTHENDAVTNARQL